MNKMNEQKEFMAMPAMSKRTSRSKLQKQDTIFTVIKKQIENQKTKPKTVSLPKGVIYTFD